MELFKCYGVSHWPENKWQRVIIMTYIVYNAEVQRVPHVGPLLVAVPPITTLRRKRKYTVGISSPTHSYSMHANLIQLFFKFAVLTHLPCILNSSSKDQRLIIGMFSRSSADWNCVAWHTSCIRCMSPMRWLTSSKRMRRMSNGLSECLNSTLVSWLFYYAWDICVIWGWAKGLPEGRARIPNSETLSRRTLQDQKPFFFLFCFIGLTMIHSGRRTYSGLHQAIKRSSRYSSLTESSRYPSKQGWILSKSILIRTRRFNKKRKTTKKTKIVSLGKQRGCSRYLQICKDRT